MNASKVRVAALGDSAMSRLTDRIGSVKFAFADGDGGIFNKISFKGTINDSSIGKTSVQSNFKSVMNDAKGSVNGAGNPELSSTLNPKNINFMQGSIKN